MSSILLRRKRQHNPHNNSRTRNRELLRIRIPSTGTRPTKDANRKTLGKLNQRLLRHHTLQPRLGRTHRRPKPSLQNRYTTRHQTPMDRTFAQPRECPPERTGNKRMHARPTRNPHPANRDGPRHVHSQQRRGAHAKSTQPEGVREGHNASASPPS